MIIQDGTVHSTRRYLEDRTSFNSIKWMQKGVTLDYGRVFKCKLAGLIVAVDQQLAHIDGWEDFFLLRHSSLW